MGDTQNLTACAQLFEQLANHTCNTTANTHIDFVEYECWRCHALGDNDLYR